MNMNMMEMDMMSPMGLLCIAGFILILVLAVLGIAALIKYLKSGPKGQ